MTNNTKKKGQPAPERKHTAESEIKKAGHYAGAVVGYTYRFAVIWVCAVALGFLVHWTDVNCDFIGDSMIHMGHQVETLLYLFDTVLLVWSVTLHTIHTLIEDWKALRHAIDTK